MGFVRLNRLHLSAARRGEMYKGRMLTRSPVVNVHLKGVGNNCSNEGAIVHIHGVKTACLASIIGVCAGECSDATRDCSGACICFSLSPVPSNVERPPRLPFARCTRGLRLQTPVKFT